MAFWLLALLWGANFIFMKMASELIDATEIVFVRVLFGFVPILAFALLTRSMRLEHLRYLGHFIVMSFLAATVYYYGFARGTTLLPSGIAGVVSGSIPLFSYLLAVLFVADEKWSRARSLGVTAGFVGIVIIANPLAGSFASASVQGVLYMTLGAMSLGASFVYARRFVAPLAIHPSALAAYQLGLALLILIPLSDGSSINKILRHPDVAIAVVLGLGLLGTGVAYILYYFLISKLGAVTASSVSYVAPVFALLIGTLIAGEEVTPIEYAASGLILGGVVLLRNAGAIRFRTKVRQALIPDRSGSGDCPADR